LPYAGDILSPSLGVYWPSRPQPLAAPDTPGNRLWWDARYRYRREVLFDAIARRAPAGTVAEVLWDGEAAVREGKVRADGADVHIVYWDGQWWHESARAIRSGAGGRGWRISFVLADGNAGTVRYHMYYGYSGVLELEPGLARKDEHAGPALLMALGPQESVEWGPTVTWTAHSTATQTLVSPDGRLVFEHPAGGLRQDTRVRLRIVPASERSGFGPLPNYEFHADPVPQSPDDERIAQWNPPVQVSINWAGLPGDASIMTWAHFRHDPVSGAWNAVPIEIDAETGVLRFTTDQP
jgi:hypothetical protein